MSAIHSRNLDAARRSLRGDLLTSTDPEFARSHLGFNLAAQHQPDLVIRAADASDVSTAVKLALDLGLHARVQSTGHGIGIPMQGGVLINTAAMQGVRVDAATQRAVVSAGTRWQAVIDAASANGLATLCGSSPTVGVVGYTLGGGMGPMARTFGFVSDRVRRLQLIDAAGELLEVDATRHADLFWALRGGKPDIGVVTECEFDLVDAPHYYGGSLFFAGDDAAAVLHEFSRWAPSLPESVSTSIALLRLPDLPELPEPLRGRLSVHLRFVHIGDAERGAQLLSPMRSVRPTIIDAVEVSPAAAIPSVHQDPADPLPARDEALILREFPAAAVDAILNVAGPGVDSPLMMVEIRLMGGALSRPGEHDSAVGGRHGAFNACFIGPYPPPLEEAVDAASAAVAAALQPWSTGGALINFQGAATDAGQVRRAWTPEVRDRLDHLKQTHDPSGIFRFAYSAG